VMEQVPAGKAYQVIGHARNHDRDTLRESPSLQHQIARWPLRRCL